MQHLKRNKQETNLCYGLILFIHKEKNNLDFARKMEEVVMSVKEESHPKELEKMEQRNIKDYTIWVNLNESMNDNQYELLQTVNILKQ